MPKYLSTGDRVTVTLPWSEVMMSMRIADVVAEVEIVGHRPHYPMAQVWINGSRYSAPVLPAEAGIYTDHQGRLYVDEWLAPAQ